MGRNRPRAKWRFPSVSRSETLMPGKFTLPAQIKWRGSPQGLPCGAYGGPAKEAVEKQISDMEAFIEERA